MVKVKDLEENENEDIEDQILRYQLLITSAAAEINIKDDVFDSEDQFSEEEPSTSDKETDINSVKTEPETYSPLRQTHFSDAPGNPDYLSMYCDDKTPLAVTVKEENRELHEGFRCDVCNGSIIGFRYTCVQCSTFDMCVACETSGAHDQHYVLRIPGPRPFKNVEVVLEKIRNCLGSELDPLSSVVINNLYNIRLSDNFKDLNVKMQQTKSDSNPVDDVVSVPDGSIPEVTADSKNTIKTEKIDNNNGKSKRKVPSKQPYVKKPLNAFMLFLKEMRTKVPNNDTGNKMLSAYHKLIGRHWHNLSEEERAVYYKKAREERRLHMLRYPNWKVSTAGRKKKRRTYVKENGVHKKCRATYGLAYRDKWCTGCKRKKKCQRYMTDLAEDKANASSPTELGKVKLKDTSNETENAVTALNSLSNEYIITQRLAAYLKYETSPLSVSPNDSQT